MDNMTAKVSCFARAYHYKNNDIHIFVDDMAAALLGDDYEKISESMIQLSPDKMTVKYFNDYNNANPEHRMETPVGVRYLLASRSRLINESKV